MLVMMTAMMMVVKIKSLRTAKIAMMEKNIESRDENDKITVHCSSDLSFGG